MKLLLDTNAYTSLMQGDKHSIDTVSISEHVYLSMTVVGELLYGFRIGNREKMNLEKLSRFLEQSVVSLMGIDYDTCEVYARIGSLLRQSGQPIPTNDLWIASTAMCNNLTLMTADKHFSLIPGLNIVNPLA
ncbi:MAG: type II toxin-antitoxin system VapC family toxin [Verrucomicrobiota bacterium]|nr:type II toxin-antitoxin system VapC family toxin [Verrucomicrobiota bacterium]